MNETIKIFEKDFLPWIENHQPIEYRIVPSTNSEFTKLKNLKFLTKIDTVANFFRFTDELFLNGNKVINIINLSKFKSLFNTLNVYIILYNIEA